MLQRMEDELDELINEKDAALHAELDDLLEKKLELEIEEWPDLHQEVSNATDQVNDIRNTLQGRL